MNKKSETGFVSHLIELRQRLINSLIFLSILFVICYYFSDHIYGFLVDPYAQAVKNDDIERRLIFTALQETFLTYLKVSFFAAFFITSPFILIQIWKFNSYSYIILIGRDACLLSNNAISYKIFSFF